MMLSCRWRRRRIACMLRSRTQPPRYKAVQQDVRGLGCCVYKEVEHVRMYIHICARIHMLYTLYTCVYGRISFIYTCQSIDMQRTHSHSHKSVGIPRVHVANPVCNDEMVARKPGHLAVEMRRRFACRSCTDIGASSPCSHRRTLKLDPDPSSTILKVFRLLAQVAAGIRDDFPS